MNIAIHYHFRITKALMSNPAKFRSITFEEIPLFSLYPMRHLGIVREIIELLSHDGMPNKFQKIFGKIAPPRFQSENHYRTEIVPLTFCELNRQKFFVRAYRLRQMDFFKVEVTFHSDTLGAGKHYSLMKAVRGAESFFDHIAMSVDSIDPFRKHCDDYFFVRDFEKEVGALDMKLSQLKQVKDKRLKRRLKERFGKEVKGFQEDAKEIAKEKLSSLKSNEAVRANLNRSLQLAE